MKKITAFYFRLVLWFSLLAPYGPLLAQNTPQTGDTRWAQWNATAWQNVTASVSTIAALKAQIISNLATGTTLAVQGYYAAGDGGGGLFTYNSTSTATPNNGSVIQPTAGAGRWLLLNDGAVSVRQFGAKGDGVTNDTSAVQAAVSSGAGKVILPAGNYLLGTVNITAGLAVAGYPGRFEGNSGATVITPSSATTDIFKVNCLQPVTFRDLSFAGLPQTAGNAITLDYTGATSVANAFSTVDNCVFDGMSTGVFAKAASSWHVTNCTFWNIPAAGAPNSQGISVSNTFNVDQGDGYVAGCTFAGLGFAGTGITWVSGDGLRIVSNKFLIANPINANLSGVAGGQFYVTGNSFDNLGTGGVGFFELTGTTSFSNIIIAHNLFSGYGATDTMLTVGGLSAAHLTNVTIANNQFSQTGGSITYAVNTDYVDRLTFSGNQFYNSNSTGTAVNIGSHCTGVILGADNFSSGFTSSFVSGSAYSGSPGNFTTGGFSGLISSTWATNAITEAVRFSNTNNVADNGNFIDWQLGGFGKQAGYIRGRRLGAGVNFHLEIGASADFSTTDAGTVLTIAPGGISVAGSSRVVPTTVSGLPSASPSGQIATVTDATNTVIVGLGLVVVGGGTNFSPVYSDGTNWRQF